MADQRIEDEINALKADMASLRSDIAALTGVMKEDTSSRMAGMRSTMDEQLRLRRQELRDLLDRARDRSRRTVDDFEESIGEHPFGSIAAAAGVGFIIGRLLELGGRR